MTQIAPSTRSTPLIRVFKFFTSQAFSGLVIVGALIAGYFALHHLENGGHAPTHAEDEAEEDANASLPNRIELSEQQIATSGIKLVTLEVRKLEPVRMVPGRIEYNANRLLELKSPMSAIARRVLAEPGQHLESGALLAVLDGPEVGMARAELARLNTELEIRIRERENAMSVARNLKRLLDSLGKRIDVRVIEEEFDDLFLGEHRERLISAYSRFLLAESLSDSIKSLADKGISSTKVLLERQSAREVAFAEFRGLSQQATIDAGLDATRLEGEVNYARRMVRVGEQKLAALAGNFSTELDTGAESALTELDLRAPFPGTIQKRMIVESERIVPHETLFVLADTSRLWVVMDIREKLWDALQLKSGTIVHVTTTALPDKHIDAQIEFVGGSVSSQTRAVPLVASLPNSDGDLKPGMLAWVTVPTGNAEQHLAVPPGSIVQHQGVSFVFVEEKPGEFRRVNVVSGIETAEWTAVTGDLQPGARVVAEGAFILKSELLLESEEE